MQTIPLGVSDWGSENQNLSDIKLENMYIAENPFSLDGMSRYVRPSLTEEVTVGLGPIRAVWQGDGVFDNDFFIVSGTSVYRYPDGGVPVKMSGSISGTGLVEIDGSIDRVVFVNSSGIIYTTTDGTSLTTIALPDGQLCQSVAQIDAVFLFAVKDSYRFYWMNPGESAPDALSFASAERTPDDIVAIRVLSDEIWMLCEDSIEVWSATGDQDFPYARITGRSYTDGCVSKFSVAESSFKGFPCLLWVNDEREVILGQGNPQKISNTSIEEKLRNSTTFKAWAFRRLRNDFYILTTDTETLVYNLDQQSWSVWYSYDENVWRAHIGCQDGKTILAGDFENNFVWRLGELGVDDGNQPIVSKVRGFVPSIGLQVSVDSVNIRCNQGWTSSYSTTPYVELKWSDDYGFTWSEPFQMPLGTKGSYKTDITYRSLGLMERPGRLFEISFTGLDNFRIDYATLNEV